MLEPLHYEKLIKNALEQYGITDYTSSFLRHNENITFQITNRVDGKSYVLRIHSPIHSGLQGVQHTFEGLTSEMELLNGLEEQTALHLQRPIKNKKGRFVTTIVGEENSSIPLATLLTWKEGVVYTGKEENLTKIAYEVGIVLAKLHNFTNNWTLPQPFIRPVYDIQKYWNLAERLQYGVHTNLIDSKDYDVIRVTMEKIQIVFDHTPKTPDYWGIIHADLQGGNIIVNNETVIPIDFGFSGYGYYLFDLGVTLTSFDKHHRHKVLEGYKTIRTYKKEDELLITAGFLLAIIGGFGFSVNKKIAHEWIQRRMPYVTQNYCRAFLNNESFLLEVE